jgi:hypothetical protein
MRRDSNCTDKEATNMLEPDQWDAVLSRVTGTIYRETERISSNALLNLLVVGPDPSTRQKVGKRFSGNGAEKSLNQKAGGLQQTP